MAVKCNPFQTYKDSVYTLFNHALRKLVPWYPNPLCLKLWQKSLENKLHLSEEPSSLPSRQVFCSYSYPHNTYHFSLVL